MKEKVLYGVLTESVGLMRVYFEYDEAENYRKSLKSTIDLRDSLIVPVMFSTDTTKNFMHKTPSRVWATIFEGGASIRLSVSGDIIPTEPVRLLDYDHDETIIYKKKIGRGQFLVRRKDNTGATFYTSDLGEGYFSKPFEDWLENSGIKKS